VTETAAEFIERKPAEWEAKRGQPVRTKDVGREGWLLVEVEGVRAHEGGAQAGDVEYRFGYYIVGRIGRAAHRWTWGQFSPLIPHPDLQRLLDKARADGTLLP